MAERVRLDARRHEIVLARPLTEALALAAAGALLLAHGWPLSPAGALLLAAAAARLFPAVWRWERTRLVITTDRLSVVYGTLRRHAAVVALEHLGPIEVEQSLLGRLLGYGTVRAGDLEIPYVPRPHEVSALLD
jgi:membrane protein YdbS with pleckstrin-like domain